MRTVVIGAGGYVGRRLAPRLVEAGHQVVAVGRRIQALPDSPGVEAIAADAADRDRMVSVLRGADAAYWLVHSMTAAGGFAERDLHLARTFADAAAEAGVGRIVYLGALGTGSLSAHLASRQAVGAALASSGVAVVELRAAVILGAGSASFDMLRHLVERLPVMVCPRWVGTRIQPVSERSVLAHLERALEVPPGVYEIGDPDVVTYAEMMQSYARVRGLHRRRILVLPMLSLKLSAYWVDLVTPLDRHLAHTLVDSLASEVTVQASDRTARAFGIPAVGLDEALRTALEQEADTVGRELMQMAPTNRGTVRVVRAERPLPPNGASSVAASLGRIGGDYGWYGLALGWRLRTGLGRLLGERLRLRAPDSLIPGVAVDWWTVTERTNNTLVLRSDGWNLGDGWLGYTVEDGPRPRLVQAAGFRPRGVPGHLYWTVLRPLHSVAFRRMATHRASPHRRHPRKPHGSAHP